VVNRLSRATSPKRFQATLAAVDLPEQQFPDVRHYAPLFLLAPRVPMRVVMATLGQSQMATTGDLYSQVVPAAQKNTLQTCSAVQCLPGFNRRRGKR
jgi:hypothetical protein